MPDTSVGSIVQFGDPLGFRLRQGARRSPVITGAGADTYKVEAHTLGGHQKEAIVTEGSTGSTWRLASDEGRAMKGDDLAPFPLGFFNAGVMSDLYNRIASVARSRGSRLDGVRISMSHLFGSNGSFIQSTARAFSESVALKIDFIGSLDGHEARQIAGAACTASPAIALLRTPMQENTFALYINGRRRKVIEHRNSVAGDVRDPFLVYTSPPRPCDEGERTDLLVKLGSEGPEDTTTVPLASADKRLFAIDAVGAASPDTGEFTTETWIARPGMTHFSMTSDETAEDRAPSGLGLMSAGIGFCYLTQLLRYIDAQKLDVRNARLVQFNPYSTGEVGRPGPIDTHLFLNGNAPDEVHLNLLSIAAHTCFMHVAAATALEPDISLSLNGQPLA